MPATKAKPKTANRTKARTAAAKIPTGPDRYYNRELSWLQFNRRVLEEAGNLNHPLLERLRFLSISASNLDEFFMVRAAGLYGQVSAGVTEVSVDGKSPEQQLRDINVVAAELVSAKSQLWSSLKRELDKSGLCLVDPEDLTKDENDWVRKRFRSHLFPVLTPLNVDPSHPFPFILNKGLTIAVNMTNEEDQPMTGLIPIPVQLGRFVRLPQQSNSGQEARFITIESVVGLFIQELFPSFEIKGHGAFRVLRRQ